MTTTTFEPCTELDCPHTVACTDEALIYRNREAIEHVDRKIAELVKLRKVHSERVGRLKSGLNLPRTDLGQERVVIERYSSALGPYGASIAQDILRYCKG